MPQSTVHFSKHGDFSPTRLTGVIAAALAALSFLVWSIWQVFVGARSPGANEKMSYIAH
jgi:hypothetical protein